MKNNHIKLKKLLFLTSVVITIGLLSLVTSIYFYYNEFDLQKNEFNDEDTIRTNFLSSIQNSIQKSQQDDVFKLKGEIFGYKIISEAVDPIEYDQNGLLFINSEKSGGYNIKLLSKFGSFVYKDVSIRGRIIFDSTQNYFLIYNFDVPKQGFFMNLLFFENKIQIDMAFDGGDCQLCYAGLIDKGYKEIAPLYPHNFESDIFSTDIKEICSISPNNLKDKLIQNQKENIIIDNTKYLEEMTISGYSYTKYGVIHEAYEFYLTYPEDLPDDYWEPYTSINIGIYRYLPSEAQIKSDLQYYNKDTWRGRLFMRDILAYHEISHGGPSWYINGGNTITPNEIEDLWYHYYNPYSGEEIDVYPWDTIAIVDACYSYYNPSSGTNPAMAKAFVDYGAEAFVGSTITIPADSDNFMRAFWYDLCQNNYNVRTATITLSNTYGHGWNLGAEWRIYGNQYATLP